MRSTLVHVGERLLEGTRGAAARPGGYRSVRPRRRPAADHPINTSVVDCRNSLQVVGHPQIVVETDAKHL